MNHEKYLRIQSQKISKRLGKETKESRRIRLEKQGGLRATCGTVFADKRHKSDKLSVQKAIREAILT